MEKVVFISEQSLWQQFRAKLLEVNDRNEARIEIIGGMRDGERLLKVDFDPTGKLKRSWHRLQNTG